MVGWRLVPPPFLALNLLSPVALILVVGLLAGAEGSQGRPAETAFRPDPEFFKPKNKPRPGEWLDCHREPGQCFARYRASRPRGPTPQRRRIVLQPLGPFTPAQRALLEELAAFAAAFFDLPVKIARELPLPNYRSRQRRWGHRSWRQYHAPTILSATLRPRLPLAAICYLGITMEDLYPEASWNYVFGLASLRERVGVYSLARYSGAFWGEPETTRARRRARSFHVLAHETGHMFSLAHCTACECLMNGSNSLAELDSQPLFLCPECLRKLHWNLGFDVRARYRALKTIYRRAALAPQADWIARRLARIGPSAPAGESRPSRRNGPGPR